MISRLFLNFLQIVFLSIPSQAQVPAKVDPGVPAPYEGYLVAPSAYRTMLSDIREKNDFEMELKSCLNTNEPNEKFQTELLVGSGFVAGILSAFLFSRITK